MPVSDHWWGVPIVSDDHCPPPPPTCTRVAPLQGVTTTPFRVVDEINQGMDSRNERKVWAGALQACAPSGRGDGAGAGWLGAWLWMGGGAASDQAQGVRALLVSRPPPLPAWLMP
jgi:hypothetical protein